MFSASLLGNAVSGRDVSVSPRNLATLERTARMLGLLLKQNLKRCFCKLSVDDRIDGSFKNIILYSNHSFFKSNITYWLVFEKRGIAFIVRGKAWIQPVFYHNRFISLTQAWVRGVIKRNHLSHDDRIFFCRKGALPVQKLRNGGKPRKCTRTHRSNLELNLRHWMCKQRPFQMVWYKMSFTFLGDQRKFREWH